MPSCNVTNEKNHTVVRDIVPPYNDLTSRLRAICGQQYDGVHPTARFSVSTGVKIKNFMRMKIKDNMKKIIELYQNKYFITKFAFI